MLRPGGPDVGNEGGHRHRRAVALAAVTGLAVGLLVGCGHAARSASPTPTGRSATTGTTPAGASTTTSTTRGTATTTTTPVTTTSASAKTTTTMVTGPPCPSAGWTVRRKVAQLVMIGVDPVGTADATHAVETLEVGGIFVDGATGLLTSGVLPKLVGPDGVRPFVAVDEEGGRVQTIDKLDGDLPSARVQARTDGPAAIQRLAHQRGLELARLGVTVDFAPVVDVSDQPDDAVIGDRSYSNDPAVVQRDARAFAQGLRGAGLLPVYKHFPGHGHAVGDSHKGAATTPPLSAMGPDLQPYRTLLGESADEGVMVGHLVVPGLTGGLPASLSPAAIDGLLRHDIGFHGVVFTDDLGGMKAITARFGAAEAARRAIAAGADEVLFAHFGSPATVIDSLAAFARNGSLPMARIDDAVGHILRAKGYACG